MPGDKVIITRKHQPIEVDKGVWVYKQQRRRKLWLQRMRKHWLEELVTLFGAEKVTDALQFQELRFKQTIETMLKKGNFKQLERYLKEQHGYYKKD